jgi:hypothetical protein
MVIGKKQVNAVLLVTSVLVSNTLFAAKPNDVIIVNTPVPVTLESASSREPFVWFNAARFPAPNCNFPVSIPAGKILVIETAQAALTVPDDGFVEINLFISSIPANSPPGPRFFLRLVPEKVGDGTNKPRYIGNFRGRLYVLDDGAGAFHFHVGGAGTSNPADPPTCTAMISGYLVPSDSTVLGP